MPITEFNIEKIYADDKNLKPEAVHYLLEWVNRKTHLPKITERQAILFLHSAYYDVVQTKHFIDTYFTIKTANPNIFGSRTLKDPLFKTTVESALLAFLPTLTPPGDIVGFARLTDYNTSIFHPDYCVRLYDTICLLHLHQNGPPVGMQLIIDMKDTTFGHFWKFSLSLIRIFLQYLQEAMPVRLKYVHFINIVPFLNKLITLMKPFLHKGVIDYIVPHTTMTTLDKYIPKEVLPEDYGGSYRNTLDLQEEMINIIADNEEFLKTLELQTVDEKKRVSKSESTFEIKGSKVSLNINSNAGTSTAE